MPGAPMHIAKGMNTVSHPLTQYVVDSIRDSHNFQYNAAYFLIFYAQNTAKDGMAPGADRCGAGTQR